MGCGKSTIGKELANQIGWKFIDLDREVEADLNDSLQNLFSRCGRNGWFEEAEMKVIESSRVKGVAELVVATGGRTYLEPRKRLLLESSSKTFWLYAEPITIAKRLYEHDQVRFSLLGSNVDAAARSLSNIEKQRRHLFAKYSNVSTSNGEQGIPFTLTDLVTGDSFWFENRLIFSITPRKLRHFNGLFRTEVQLYL